MRIGAMITLGIGISSASSIAAAHFSLESPPSWQSQDATGSPQKAAPCGEDPAGEPTGTVTTYQSGQTITITIDEKIFHPGHYRVALAVEDRSELPEDPPVEAGDTPCGTTTIEDPPVFPVLADGVLPHDAPFDGPQTFEVTLPPDVTCDHCTLQVIEFMSNHGLNNPGGCFYHHCADIALQADPVPSDGGSGAGGGGASAGDASEDGCSVAAARTGLSRRGTGAMVAMVAAAAAGLLRRGRRRAAA